ncbi:hypothetical protein FXO37_31320 [Capsicum annuum]|nr:hypothetical protein FXO37_31320 [Capsicum annuum]
MTSGTVNLGKYKQAQATQHGVSTPDGSGNHGIIKGTQEGSHGKTKDEVTRGNHSIRCAIDIGSTSMEQWPTLKQGRDTMSTGKNISAGPQASPLNFGVEDAESDLNPNTEALRRKE